MKTDFVWPHLERQGLHLQPLITADAGLFWQKVDGDRFHLSTWLPWVEKWKGKGHACAWVEAEILQAELGNGGTWALRSEQGLHGALSVHWIQWEHRCASLGWWLFSDSTGRKIMGNSLDIAVEWLFGTLQLRRLEASCAEENHASNRLALSLGFVQEGRRREAEFLHGKFLNHNSFSLLQGEWEQARTRR